MERLRRSQKWICGIVLFLGVVAAILGFLAEVNRIKDAEIHIINNQCIYTLSPALIFGVTAALVLLIAQILINVFGCCICCTSGPPPPPHTVAASNRSIAVICLVACWITFLNAFALLMAGASLNSQRQRYMWFGGECNVVKPLVFAGGALLALATVVLGLIFYLASSAAKVALSPLQQVPFHLERPYMAPYCGPYGSTSPNARAYSYQYPLYSVPSSQTQIPVSTDPNVPVMGYPEVVTGYPKPMPPGEARPQITAPPLRSHLSSTRP